MSCSCPEHADKHTLSFLQGILMNNLNQHVKDFTRQRGNDQPSTLDLIFTNYATDLQNIVLESPLGKSDHVVIKFSLQETNLPDESCEKSYPDYKSADFAKINSILSSMSWETLMANKNANTSWLFLKDTITDLMNKYVPIKKNLKRFNNRPQWMSRKTESAINKKKKSMEKVSIQSIYMFVE